MTGAAVITPLMTFSTSERITCPAAVIVWELILGLGISAWQSINFRVHVFRSLVLDQEPPKAMYKSYVCLLFALIEIAKLILYSKPHILDFHKSVIICEINYRLYDGSVYFRWNVLQLCRSSVMDYIFISIYTLFRHIFAKKKKKILVNVPHMSCRFMLETL